MLDVTWEGAGCSISQASASMLAELVEPGCRGPRHPPSSTASATALRSRGTIRSTRSLLDASALSGVSKYVARVKCAMLAWVALEDALARA